MRRIIVKPYGKDKFEVVEDRKIVLIDKSFLIPKGFKTDGASIPRIFWCIYPPYRSEYFTAVVLHDYLCQLAKSKSDYKIADLVLKEAMILSNCNLFKVFVFYNACNIYHKLKCFIKGIK